MRASGSAAAPAAAPTLEDVEVALLLEGVYRHYGYDFRDYALPSIRRRVRQAMHDEGAATVSALQEKVLHDPRCLQRLVLALSVNVTSMFRDPHFYQALRERVVPLLRTYPKVRVWHAGCATGEEVYSFAIVLEEEGLYERCRIYATDMNELVLKRAASGEVGERGLRESAARYQRSGGRRAYASFFAESGDRAALRPSLLRNVVFAQHNLVTDRSFNEFNVVFCRNVLIYFTRALQDRVHRLLYESLARFGFLALGSKETVQFSPHEAAYQDLGEKVYRKVA
jgi:chemotaxis protein methyltransferase CheR